MREHGRYDVKDEVDFVEEGDTVSARFRADDNEWEGGGR